MIRLNKLRNRAITATVKVLEKAKAKPNPLRDTLDDVMNDPSLSDNDKIKILEFMQTKLKEIDNA